MKIKTYEDIKDTQESSRTRTIASLREKNARLGEKVIQLQEALRIKNANLSKVSIEYDYLRKRVVALYGREALKTLLNTTDYKFDAENYDKVTQLKEELRTKHEN